MRIEASASLLLSLILACAPNLAARSQEKKPGQDVIKIGTELVQVDVLVTDRDNRPVKGLKREDFELYDNNKLQPITTFAFEESGARRIEDSPEPPRSLPKVLTAGGVRRVLAFVVDNLHMNFPSVYRTRRMLENFIEKEMQPGDLVLILPTGGGSGLYQQFTSDRRVLRRAVNRLRVVVTGSDLTSRRSILPPSRPVLIPGRPPVQFPSRGLNTIDPLEEADIRATLGTLKELMKAMNRLPGRKVSVFVSEGLRIFQTQTTQDLNEVTARAARANVVFYTIDPRGLIAPGATAADDVSGADLADFLDQQQQDLREGEASLSALAADTGGRFYRNTNDIAGALRDVLEENSSYYVLGFQPEEKKWDGKFHKLKVVVRNRPDLKVTTRKGYLAGEMKSKEDERKNLSPKVAEVIEAISSPLVRRDIDLQLTPFYVDDPKREPLLTLLLHIDAKRLNFREVNGRHNTELETFGSVFDASGKAVDNFADTITLNLLPQTYETSLKRGFVSTRQFNVKPGVYQVRMFVRETSSGLIGTANNFVEIPEMKGDRLTVSSIFTETRAVEKGQVVETAGAGGTLSQRRFSRDGQFGYTLLIYNAKPEGRDSQPQLEIRTRVFRGTEVVFDSQPKPVEILKGSTPARIITSGGLKLSGLEPGDYTLEVSVRDKLRKKDSRAVVRQELDFSVE